MIHSFFDFLLSTRVPRVHESVSFGGGALQGRPQYLHKFVQPKIF